MSQRETTGKQQGQREDGGGVVEPYFRKLLSHANPFTVNKGNNF